MLLGDNELLYEYIRAAHDPDPRRAARYRPFSYPDVPIRLDGVPVTPVSPPLLTSAVKVLARWLVSTAQRHVPLPHPQPIACCPPSCCAAPCC